MPINEFLLPSLGSTDPTYENIIKMLQTPTRTESEFLPEIQGALSPRGPEFQRQLSSLFADLSGAYAKRGLTGSSIEAQGLAAAGAQATSRFAAGTAGEWANILARVRAGDVSAQRQLIQMISMAMGEELTAQRDISMFQQQLQAMQEASSQERAARERASWLGAGTELGKAGLQAWLLRGMGGGAGAAGMGGL